MNVSAVTAVIERPCFLEFNCVLEPIINSDLYILPFGVFGQVIQGAGRVPDKGKVRVTFVPYLINFLRVYVDISNFGLNSEPDFLGNPVVPAHADRKEEIIFLNDLVGIRSAKHPQQPERPRIILIHHPFGHKRVNRRDIKNGVEPAYGVTPFPGIKPAAQIQQRTLGLFKQTEEMPALVFR